MSFVCHLDVICMRSYLSLCTLMSPVCHSFVLVYHPYVPRMYSYAIHMSLVCTRMSSVFLSYVPVCHSYVLVCHPYVTRMYSYVIRMSLVCTRMSFVCHSYVIRMSLVCHSYVTRMYSHVIRMSLVYTHMWFICHSCVLVCHSYVTRMYSYVIPMSLVCTRMSSVCYSYVALQWTITIRTNLYLQMFAPRNLQYCSVKWKSYLKHLSWHLTQFWQVLPLSWSMSHP